MALAEVLGEQERYYGRRVSTYDLFVRRVLPLKAARRALAHALSVRGGGLVVEMGCGTGANFGHVARAVPGVRVVGLDVTRAMLGRARENLRGTSLDADLVQADARRPPIRGPVEAVFASFVAEAFDDPGEVVRVWSLLVRPGGRIVLLDARPSAHGSPLDPAFKAFVAATYPRDGRRGASEVARILAERDEATRRALEGLGARVREETFLDGLVSLKVAELPGGGGPAAEAVPERHPPPEGGLERALHATGLAIAPVLFAGARTPEEVARRLRFAYRLAGVRIARAERRDLVERTEFLCPYRNLGREEHGARFVCHRKLDRVDDGYVTYLAERGIEYRRPVGLADSERCASEVCAKGGGR